MHQEAEGSQRATLSMAHTPAKKWLASLGVGVGVVSLSMPAQAQTASAIAGSSWVGATIVSVSSVVVLWMGAAVLSGFARKMRWVSPHRHSRLARAVQVVFGGLLLLAMMVPYLAMNHPMVAAGLVVTALLMAMIVGSRNRELSRG